ncbi:hypothetical protein FACS189483_01440 [Spirochaetia bacterium]|nr:hypothetical protein FACS189483_01440 [Spirochaetia bacterium]
MGSTAANLEVLATRPGFNSAVRHITKTLRIIESLGDTVNLGDILFEPGDPELTGERIGLILRMLLVDKMGYSVFSSNLASTAADIPSLAAEFEKWKAVDLVAAYHHPDLGLLVVNPKSAGELAGFGMLRERELLVIYAGKGAAGQDAQCQKAAVLAAALFAGEKPKTPADLYAGKFTTKKTRAEAAPRRAAGAADKKARRPENTGKKAEAVGQPRFRIAVPPPASAASFAVMRPVEMTPLYSVSVRNELFHNGNVEAWKRIIASYNARYPNLQVYIYYEGERILDINALFTWGKVKHGSTIHFAVVGNGIRDVSKLQRYLAQGASPQFEAFLRSPMVNGVLRLF